MDKENALKQTEKTIRAGQLFIEEGIKKMEEEWDENESSFPLTPCLLYGMASVLFEAIYATAPNEKDAEKVINMALVSAQETIAKIRRLTREEES